MKASIGPAFVVALLCATNGPVHAQFSVSRFVVANGGGTRSSGGTFGVGGTIGQPQTSRSTGGAYAVTSGFWVGGSGGVSGISEGPDGGEPDAPGVAPLLFRVFPASPNPVGESMALTFDLPEARAIRLEVYDAAGRAVRTLADEVVGAGRSEWFWDRRDQWGTRVPGGIYFLRLIAPPDQRHQKVVVLP